MNASAKKNAVVTASSLASLVALYATGIIAVNAAPTPALREMLVGWALPLDCMVILPALFYVLVIRRHRLSPVFVLPVLWAGAALASIFARESDMTLIAALGTLALVVEVLIAAREIMRFAKAFREARRASDEAIEWFFAPLLQMTRSERASSLAANELAMFYYALFSWKQQSKADCSEAFSYHKDSGYIALLAGMMLVVPVETIVVHMLVSQFSDVAAWILTISSIYLVLWLVADCRASVLRPILVDEAVVKIRSGMRFSADIPLASIASYTHEAPALGKARLINLGAMGNASGWIVFSEPVEVRTAFGGTKRIEAVGVAVDDKNRFKAMLDERLSQQELPSPAPR